MLVGYARVSTREQNLELQKDALTKAGCETIYTDQLSSVAAFRPGLDETLKFLRSGDTLVVWRLDRLGRTLRHLIDLVTTLEKKRIGLKSLQESLDTTTSGGKLIFHLFGALAEFERNLIRERTHAGLEAARARGRKGGRPKVLDANKREVALTLYHAKKHTVIEICRMMGISKPTLYSYLRNSPH